MAPVGGGYYFIKAKHSNRCLDVAWASRQNGAPAVQANCSGGSNQVWRFVPAPGRAPLVNGPLGRVPQIDNSAGIVADHSGMVLDVFGHRIAHNTPAVQAYPPHGEVAANQQWRFLRAG